MTKPSYRGLLGKKITRKQIYAVRSRKLGLLNEPPFDVVAEWRLKMLHLLFLHYKIDHTSPKRWQQLAISLAFAHVPAFEVARKTGSKVLYGEGFVRAVAEIRQRKRLKSDPAAIQALQAEGQYPGQLETLKARLREARAPLKARANWEKAVRASRKAFIREAMLASESPPSKGANSGKKRRS